ncbi:MAG: HD domain-containing phosphohydrolase [Pseudomonadota bacterium]|nr:HD domain-containing phosphohydrolase [Pseudomonadota bacterium]
MKKQTTTDSLSVVERLSRIGVALSAQQDINRLLELIIDEACGLTAADGGTLYNLSPDGDFLEFAIVYNRSLGVRKGGTGEPIDWPPVRLKQGASGRNMANVSAYAALTGQVVNIPDVYNAAGFDFQGTRDFDARNGYRSRSMLVVPMRDHEGDLIGVLQLLNATDDATGRVMPFSRESQMITESFASQAAVAISQKRLIKSLEELLDAFVKTIALAIDEKSPYTGGHIRRVADLTMSIAERINAAQSGPFAGVRFSDHEMQELRMAAWLHDVGKITTPERIVDKATKLTAVCDRLELIRTRGEVMIRDHELSRRRRVGLPQGVEEEIVRENDDFNRRMTSDMEFLASLNTGAFPVRPEDIARLEAIAVRTWRQDGREQPLLTEDEYRNLAVFRGTLTEDEREIINNHALVTKRLLETLPFPKRLRNIPVYAGSHHEKLDGSGYPQGMREEEMPLQARIIALADIFEALTARDRPYKRANTLSEAVSILRGMARMRHIDPDLFALFMEERIYLDYAVREMAPHLIDMPART